MMTTFDFKQVRDFASDLNAQLDRCENGEGNQCDTIDASLGFCAECLDRITDEVKKWGRDVFAGRVVFDSAAEQLWKAELLQINNRAMNLLSLGRQAEINCFDLGGTRKLGAAIFNLQSLINGWITPKLAVGPSARSESLMEGERTEEACRRIASLPPLPADWSPDDQQQRLLFQRIRSSQQTP